MHGHNVLRGEDRAKIIIAPANIPNSSESDTEGQSVWADSPYRYAKTNRGSL